MRWSVGERLRLLGRQLQAPSDRPSGGEVGDEGEDLPRKMKKAPAPGYHCASRQARRELHEAYGWFYASYRQAAEKLRLGDLTAAFPEGSFPPPRPFVGLALEPRPG
jgi:hypothetical protein